MSHPADTRPEPPLAADEATTFAGFLAWQRDTLAWKLSGVPPERAAERLLPPSRLSLLGLVRHMADVERGWFSQILAGEDVPDLFTDGADFEDVDDADVETELRTWRAEIDRSRTLVAGLPLDTLSATARHGEHYSLRWIMTHMIEEYARHNGHADLLRERIDGATGE